MSEGKLYVCGTPIGNLEDMSYRLVKTLESVDIVAAEDTRRSIKILNHLGIEKPLISYHEHNKEKVGNQLIGKMKEGAKIALVSDAGMPGISDPGEELIREAIEAGIDIECISGPVAGIHALVLSGLSTRRFAFEGFLDRQSKTRCGQLEQLMYDPRTLIFYEAPHRLKDFLKDLNKVFGERPIAISRELTKKYETFLRVTTGEAVAYYQENDPKGEYVIVVEGFKGEKPAEETIFDQMTIPEELCHWMATGISKKDAITQVAKRRKLPKKEVYAESLEL